jgi:putative hydrolase of the HAD superfamily
MELNSATSSECIMIGDNYIADIEGAKNANIDQIFYNLKEEGPNKTATYTITNLLELKGIL